MQNFSTFPKSRKCLVCQLPHCKCEKCKKLRSENKPDQSHRKQCSYLRAAGINEELLKNVDASVKEKSALNKIFDKSKQFAKGNLFTIPSMPKFNFSPSSFESFLCDIVGVVSFFIMTSLMFWFTISQYLWCFGKLLLQSGRTVKLLASILILLLCVSITIHAIKGRHKHCRNISLVEKSSDPLQPQNSTTEGQPPNAQKSCQHKKKSSNSRNSKNLNEKNKVNSPPSNDNLDKKKNPSLCDLCANKFKGETNSQSLLTDEEVFEMFKRYKLYSVPSEMKFPPSFTNVIEVLSGFYNGISGSFANAFL